jgi:hypothetical protein
MLAARRIIICFPIAAALQTCASTNSPPADTPSLSLPQVGDHELRCLSPTVLELTLVTTKEPDPAPPKEWNFVDAGGQLHLPQPGEFLVTVHGTNCPVAAVGFKRRVDYAPLRKRDLRIGNHLYLQLGRSVTDGQKVEVKNPDGKLWPAKLRFETAADPVRLSPAIHVNEVGYNVDGPKKAMVGYYLGSLGELDLPTQGESPGVFRLVEAQTGRRVYEGHLNPRPDRGFPFSCYQKVMEADFSQYKLPGEYRLQVPGLGVSFPFFINEGVAATFARAYALGLYHQRCGTDNVLPFTRFTHGPCHTALADIPMPPSRFKFTWETIAQKSSDFAENPRHTAPQLKDEASQLYPFVKRGKINVAGGHHDAGDYSKYMINCAALIHFLVFAADAFPGAATLDNFGLPESGDGRSDLLEEAKWEADFVARMQDDDGGFFFLVYPRDREYEDDVPPDHGDPQVVWPKTTAVTAAAVAALAQCASSPEFKKEFPDAAALYLKKAKLGWAFLERAIAAHGQDGAYQKITHYGNEFMHDDELAWAACEMYLATGEDSYHQKVIAWLNPSGETRRWGWWRMYESYGCAIRSYAFAARTGRLKPNQLDFKLLGSCEDEIIAAAQDQLKRSEDSAYGTSFPEETKRARDAGWYFSGDGAFDLAVAYQLDYPVLNDPRPKFMEAILGNLNYEAGCNPVNVCYLTGLGWKRPREIVNQYAENQRRVLPPTGIPVGNIQAGFSWLDKYQKELGEVSFPLDGDPAAPYPFYDRWGDSFNLSTEFVTVNQGRSLAYLAWLMARTPLKDQPWKSAIGSISVSQAQGNAQGAVVARLNVAGLDLSNARIVWEAQAQEPIFGREFPLQPMRHGSLWVEVEAQLPDGRRVFGVTNLTAQVFRAAQGRSLSIFQR